MTTFATYLAGTRKNLCLWLAIQGLERTFSERTLDVSATLGESRSQTATLHGVEVGEASIDLEKLRQVGGGLRFRLRQPHGSTVLTDIFRARARKVTFLTDSEISKTATSASLADAAALGADNTAVTVYMGAETITALVNGTTGIDGMTRGKYSSRAQVHEGSGGSSFSSGTAVHIYPPNMQGRRVYLYGSWLREDGTTTAALTQQLGTYVIDENPTWTDERTVEVNCGPIIDEYMNRSMYVGLKETTGGLAYNDGGFSDELTMEVGDASQFYPSSVGGVTTYVLAKYGYALDPSLTVTGIAALVANDTGTTPQTITVEPQALTVGVGLVDGVAESVRHIALVGGSYPVFLDPLVSFRGDADLGALDVLPGRERASFEADDWRMGAGILQTDIDTTSFNLPIGAPWTYVLDKTTSVGDYLREWLLLADAFVYGSASGLLTASRFADTTGTSSITIDSSVLVASMPPRTYVDESTIYPVVETLVNFDPGTEEFGLRVVHADAELLSRYPTRDAPRVEEFRGVHVLSPPSAAQGPARFAPPATMSEPDWQARGKSLQGAGARGQLIAEVTCKLRALAATLGSLVSVSFDASDHDGGSINGSTARVIGVRPDFDGNRVTLRLLIPDTLYRFVPSAIVTAVSTTSIANDTVTLSTTADENDDSSPSDNFAVGMVVRLWDVSAGTSQTLTVAAIPTASTLRFTAGVTGAIESGVDWLTWSTLGANSALTSGSGYDEPDLLFGMADSGTPASGAVRRWR